MRGESLMGILAVAALALNPSLVTAKSKGQSQKLSPPTSRQTTDNSFSNKAVQGSGSVTGGSTTIGRSGTKIMKTKHDTAKNSISNVR